MKRVIKHVIGFIIWYAILIKLTNESFRLGAESGFHRGYTIGQLRGIRKAMSAIEKHERAKEADRHFWDRVRWS